MNTKKKRDVLVIGTEPPCPRCDLVGVLAGETPEGENNIGIRHCAFDSPEAIELGRRLGRKVGTAKHVAKAAGITMDWDAIYGSIKSAKASLPPDSRPADTWTPELDEMLRPCERTADAAGYLMTPVLVIDGEVVHHGSVPSREKIDRLLSG
jgi:hypothetical protein